MARPIVIAPSMRSSMAGSTRASTTASRRADWPRSASIKSGTRSSRLATWPARTGISSTAAAPATTRKTTVSTVVASVRDRPQASSRSQTGSSR